MKRILIAATAVLALTACSQSENKADQPDRTAVSFDAKTNWSTAVEEMRASNTDITAFEVKGKGKIQNRRVRFNAYVSKDGQCAGKLRRPDYTVQFQNEGNETTKLYFKASRPYWMGVAGPTQGKAVADAVANQWTLYPKATAEQTDIFALCDFSNWVRYQTPEEDLAYRNRGVEGKSGIRFMGGKNGLAIVDAHDPHRVWDYRDESVELKFKSFNEDHMPKAPSYFVDLAG